MAKPLFSCWPLEVYGKHDDVLDYQFAIAWPESGTECSVFIFSGYDYGGGIISCSSRVPISKAEMILDHGYNDYELKQEMMKLVKLCGEECKND